MFIAMLSTTSNLKNSVFTNKLECRLTCAVFEVVVGESEGYILMVRRGIIVEENNIVIMDIVESIVLISELLGSPRYITSRSWPIHKERKPV